MGCDDVGINFIQSIEDMMPFDILLHVEEDGKMWSTSQRRVEMYRKFRKCLTGTRPQDDQNIIDSVEKFGFAFAVRALLWLDIIVNTNERRMIMMVNVPEPKQCKNGSRNANRRESGRLGWFSEHVPTWTYLCALQRVSPASIYHCIYPLENEMK